MIYIRRGKRWVDDAETGERVLKEVGEAYDEQQVVPRYVEASEAFGLCNVYVTKTLLCYLWDRWDDALEQEALAAPWVSAIVSLFHVPVFRFYY